MNGEDLPRFLWGVALLALVGSAIGAAIVWRRCRSGPAAFLASAFAVITAAVALIRLFPAFVLMRHPKTGRMIAAEQHQMLHFLLYGAATVAVLVIPVALMRLPRSLERGRSSTVS